MEKTFDVGAVRERFPALGREHGGRRVAYLDGPGGSQVAEPAIDAMARYMRGGGANLHGAFPTSLETEEIVRDGRLSVARFLGAEEDEISFGANMTTLTFALSRALSRGWGPGSEIVVTELDHRANVDPWARAAAERGATVRWIPVSPQTLTLELDNIEETINERTELVAVGLASNAVGTINDVAAISERAREVGAAVAVDAVHAAPHIPIDREEIGVDILTASAYKFFGPHVGVAAVKRDLFERIHTDKLDPAPARIPEKLETGTQNHEGIAGVGGALSFVSSLGDGDSLRERLLGGMRAIEDYEAALAEKLRSGLRDIRGLTLYSAPEGARKTPTAAFRVSGYSPREICGHMAGHGFFIADGHFYASTLADKLGIRDGGGWIRAGLAPYNTGEEIEAFLETLEEFVG